MEHTVDDYTVDARVVIETPYRGNGYKDLEINIRYARACMRDCLLRGELPFASHLLYTQEGILNDRHPLERTQGINAGLEWAKAAKFTIVYEDRGYSAGMEAGIRAAKEAGRPVIYRRLAGWKE